MRRDGGDGRSFSALQRAEIAEIAARRAGATDDQARRFSALQRAEIAEIPDAVSDNTTIRSCFSALQRAEIAEIDILSALMQRSEPFQCSSTSRNC